jgi:hypothetical protein
MTQADSVHSTPPTNTSVTRRSALATIAAATAAITATGASPTAATTAPDPIFAAIDAFRQADAACVAVDGDIPDDVGDHWSDAISFVMRTRPTTPAGLAALTSWARERADWLRSNGTEGGGDFCTVSATIDDATRGMSGLQPWSPPPSPESAEPDAELIELGARFEPLVDRYYVAHRRWSAALEKTHSEHDRKFGEPRDRDFQDTPEIRAAWKEASERNGLDDASARQSAIWEEMEPIAGAINAASVNSIEGLRAKALVAFREVAPLSAGDTKFSFDDAYPFQQLFTAVAEVCGLNDKMAATGYELPDIAMVDEDDEGVS